MAIDLGTGENPKIPVTLPARPYTATPANWVRTQFLTPGQFTFTPAADTTLVMAIVLGGGGGGYIFKNAAGADTPYDPAINAGGDSNILVNGVVVLSGKGGGGGTGPSAFQPRGAAALPGATAFNWVKADAPVNGGSGTSNGGNTNVAQVGGAPTVILTGTAGAAWNVTGMPTPFSVMYGGGAGSSVAMYMEATTPITFVVGKGGAGAPAGYTAPASANGTLGGGGAAGGNGGDGAVIFYEFKGALLPDKPSPVNITNYSTLGGAVGNYQTIYPGTSAAGSTSFSHTLRPRTKFVTILLVGGGGGSIVGTLRGALNVGPPTQLIIGDKTFTASSGYSSGKTEQQGMILPPFGQFTLTNYDPIEFRDGTNTSNPGGSNQQGIGGGYGNGGQGLQGAGDGSNSTLPGASGAVGLIGLGRSASGDTLSFSVAGAGIANTATYSAGAVGAVFIYETETPPAPTVTQAAELVLMKSLPATMRVTQAAELVLVKESNDVDTQVSTVYAALIMDLPIAATLTTQTAELILQKSSAGDTAITQTAELVLQKSPVATILTSQVAQSFLLSEMPTVFYLNFGTLDTPIRNQLYDSMVGRASSVPPNTKIQIEGPFAPGTQLVINDVPSGIVASVKDGDTVYIHGGVGNYWQTNMPVYAYYEENGETARLLVGNWVIIQPTLTPIVTKTYYGAYTQNQWIKTQTLSALASMQSFSTRAYARLSSLVAQASKALSAIGAALVPSATKANANTSETVAWDATKALTKLAPPEQVKWTDAHDHAENGPEIVWDKTKVLTGISNPNTFIDEKAAYGEAGYEFTRDSGTVLQFTSWSGDVQLSANYATFESETEQTQAKYGAYEQVDFEKTDVNYADVDQEFEYNNVDHSVTYEVVYIAIQGSSTARLFDMSPTSTIAYSVLTNIVWDRTGAAGLGEWLQPTGDADLQKAAYGLVDFSATPTGAHSEYTTAETIVHHGPQLGYATGVYVWTKTGAELFGNDAEKTTANAVVFNMETVEKTSANYSGFSLTPFIAMQTANEGKGPASLYKGFDTRAEIESFTENYAGVHISMKFNGYVYLLDVDKTFICEIFNNAPVKWLLQGG